MEGRAEKQGYRKIRAAGGFNGPVLEVEGQPEKNHVLEPGKEPVLGVTNRVTYNKDGGKKLPLREATGSH